MQQIQLDELLETKAPDWLTLLTEQELSMPIVLKHGFADLKQHDIQEIVEAVIMEQHTQKEYH
ncbi:hypothetical protein [Salsuginibacillus kocurii]|uniref:hypothetical protein n=1 Tax=Salsuginibacillus kocurii TaxID=427078 RepID=UPI000373DE99|nr:hypothetical protein [Salsuginibacillus kocurii]